MSKEMNGIGSDVVLPMSGSVTDEEKRAAERVVRSMVEDVDYAHTILHVLGLVVEPDSEPEPESSKPTVLGRGRDHNILKTHCPAGHEYDEENTAYDKYGHRRCLACRRARDKVKYHRLKAQRRQKVSEAEAATT